MTNRKVFPLLLNDSDRMLDGNWNFLSFCGYGHVKRFHLEICNAEHLTLRSVMLQTFDFVLVPPIKNSSWFAVWGVFFIAV